MKKLLFILFLIPLLLYGQLDLCRDCAVRIYDLDAVLKKGCCEKCLQEFYIHQLHNNITHGMLSQHYENFGSGNSFLDFPEKLSAHFLITNISPNKGYCLTDTGLIENRYYLMSLECQDSIVPSGTTFILIVDDSSSFDIGHSYYLKLHPYFKKNQSFRIIGDELCPVVSGPQTMFDLVYKKWLITMLPVNQNYFFLDSDTTKSKNSIE